MSRLRVMRSCSCRVVCVRHRACEKMGRESRIRRIKRISRLSGPATRPLTQPPARDEIVQQLRWDGRAGGRGLEPERAAPLPGTLGRELYVHPCGWTRSRDSQAALHHPTHNPYEECAPQARRKHGPGPPRRPVRGVSLVRPAQSPIERR